MSEGSEHAAILIATSYQALNRAVRGNPDTLLTDCTVLVLFAGFYIEATLNHIFEQSGKEAELRQFPLSNTISNGKNHPGMQDKLAWFYNEFIEVTKAMNWRDIYGHNIKRKLREKFPGFAEIYAFRNDISHGEINQSAKSLATAKQLRQQAKDLVGQLYCITLNNGYTVPRLVTYRDALASLENTKATAISEPNAS
jgi:hypothetical protein